MQNLFREYATLANNWQPQSSSTARFTLHSMSKYGQQMANKQLQLVVSLIFAQKGAKWEWWKQMSPICRPAIVNRSVYSFGNVAFIWPLGNVKDKNQ